MSVYMDFTAVQREGSSGLQEVSAAHSSVTIDAHEWHAQLEKLCDHEDIQEELEALSCDDLDEQPTWDDCVPAGDLARVLRAARKALRLSGTLHAQRFRVVLLDTKANTESPAKDPAALVAGDETLLLSVAGGVFTRINQRTGASTSEPLRDGLQVHGSPIGEPNRTLVARVTVEGAGSPEATDVFARVLRVCQVASSKRGRVQVTSHE